ncbi:MAG: magnesium transporter MgtE N-terminal domain-containing protein [Propionibacteriaceae bacterium]
MTTTALIKLSDLIGRTIESEQGQPLGKVDDIVARLPETGYPAVVGLVADMSGRRLFLHAGEVGRLDADRIKLGSTRLDIRPFERREREVLLRHDILGHRLVNLSSAELVRAHDVQLRADGDGWVVDSLNLRAHHWWLRAPETDDFHDWRAFEALIGHSWTMQARSDHGNLRRLRPADLADLLEDASRGEQTDILTHLHKDPELEADVFEELDDFRPELLARRTDRDVADILSRMQADDAADTLNDLPQERRAPVLGMLPLGQQHAIRRLMGYNPTSAGGLMAVDFLHSTPNLTAGQALGQVRAQAEQLSVAACTTLHLVGADATLVGTVPVTDLLRAEPEASVAELADLNPVTASPASELPKVAVHMADHNLITMPVVDHGRLVGILSIDDILDATIPQQWRNMED